MHSSPSLISIPATAKIVLSFIALSFVAQTSNAADEVNVYSSRQSFLTKPMFEKFTEETGIKVNTIFAKSGLVERLSSEGINSPADLFFTADIGKLDAALQAGVTESVSSEVLTTKIPEEFRDPHGHWFGLTNRARIIVASVDRVGADEVLSYEDLARPELKGRICTRSGKHGYMVALSASIIAHHGEDAAKSWLSGLKENLARKPQGNDRAQVKAISEGECDLAIINSYYMGAMLTNKEQVAWADSVRIIFPNQGDRGTHMNISGMSLTKSAPNKENAIRLMEFLANDVAQKMYAELNFEYPVNPAVDWSEMVESWGRFKHDPLPLADIAKHRSRASKLADEVGYDG